MKLLTTQQQEEQLSKECTFTPKINKNKIGSRSVTKLKPSMPDSPTFGPGLTNNHKTLAQLQDEHKDALQKKKESNHVVKKAVNEDIERKIITVDELYSTRTPTKAKD